MKIPGSENAHLEPEKIKDYLLSLEHPIGRSKAKFFSALGYRHSDYELLRKQLLDLASSDNAQFGQPSEFGQKYQVTGRLAGPNGKSAFILTIWIILTTENFPRFVTAYPGDNYVQRA